MSAKILIPVDESQTAQHTIDAVIGYKGLLGKEVLLLHVVNTQSAQQRVVPEAQKAMLNEAARKSGLRILEKLASPFRAAGFKPELRLELGDPEEVILRIIAEQQIELLIIGRHPGGGGMRDILFGSVANQVIRSVDCPILLF